MCVNAECGVYSNGDEVMCEVVFIDIVPNVARENQLCRRNAELQ